MLLRERLESLGRRPYFARPSEEPDLDGLASCIGAEVREGESGPVVVLEQVHALPPRAAYDPASARLLGTRTDDLLPEAGLCFLDTETTSLSSGVGNQVFLVAMAWRVPGGLLVRQYLLPDPAYEVDFLVAIVSDLEASAGLVTFNGRCFDVPVLEGRLLMARLSPESLRTPHLDLLYPTRRIFRARLGSCCLQNVETMVLGRDRGDDVPGYLIPEMYFAYLRRRDPEVLRPVLAHNRQDVVSLSLLLDNLASALGESSASHPLDRVGAGRLLETAGEADRALAIYAGLWDEQEGWDGEVWPGVWDPPGLAYFVGMRLATLHRRLGHPARAEPILEQLWRRHPGPWEAGIMLAKDLEHRRRDRAAAVEVVTAAREGLENLARRTSREEWCLADLTHRHRRLAREVDRQEKGAAR